VAEEVLIPNGHRLAGIRIDSGDIAYLTKKARAMLDVAGLTDAKISISNSLDEYLIRSVLEQGAKIDSFGVGENMITSKSAPVFGGVYKMAAVEKDGKIIPKIKISENTEKITNPGYKKVYRLIEKETQKALGDIIMFANEKINVNDDLTIYSQFDKWLNKTLPAGEFEYFELQKPVFKDGQCIYPEYTLDEIRENVKKQSALMWDEIFRLEYPHKYYVDLSRKLIDYKLKMLEEKRG
jgi:nicotinate phosphoribosyltransferase